MFTRNRFDCFYYILVIFQLFSFKSQDQGIHNKIFRSLKNYCYITKPLHITAHICAAATVRGTNLKNYHPCNNLSVKMPIVTWCSCGHVYTVLRRDVHR